MDKRSKCRALGWLHQYEAAAQYPEGMLEVCVKCRKAMFFKQTEPSRHYLAHHMRQILKPTNPRFKREYESKH